MKKGLENIINNNKCVVCAQKINQEHKNKLRKDLDERLKKFKKREKGYKLELESIEKEVKKLKEEIILFEKQKNKKTKYELELDS